ncbi:glutathione S-transferase [Cucurbitaria berberidis CBS 394.84]|uniref:Glutathione S-transferase n=1 Tax=Cucurbitaria berberidis CBS 394.84 TaxID=1168544 RepID=A0A9P4GML2_9PLEO|nr:glutathione S-transferase [Cucurbitaria berberidis CBS 394.84]KAF1849193.1 glutathione S-transferase [Cucurbitaria berberidis CBS 394.84]
MAPKINLYMTPGSCSLASHIALHESGLDFTITDLKAKTGFPPEHLHLNPKGRVPILDLDGELITETHAILTVISALVPSKNLLGSSAIEHARAHEWLAWLSGTLHGNAFACLFRPKRFIGDEKLYDAVRARGREWVKECFEFIEGKLEGGRVHAVGEAFTVVDGFLLVFYRWGNRTQFGMRENYPNYARLVDGVIKRGAVMKTIEIEGIDALND